jgi:hypothetical protein
LESEKKKKKQKQNKTTKLPNDKSSRVESQEENAGYGNPQEDKN